MRTGLCRLKRWLSSFSAQHANIMKIQHFWAERCAAAATDPELWGLHEWWIMSYVKFLVCVWVSPEKTWTRPSNRNRNLQMRISMIHSNYHACLAWSYLYACSRLSFARTKNRTFSLVLKTTRSTWSQSTNQDRENHSDSAHEVGTAHPTQALYTSKKHIDRQWHRNTIDLSPGFLIATEFNASSNVIQNQNPSFFWPKYTESTLDKVAKETSAKTWISW